MGRAVTGRRIGPAASMASTSSSEVMNRNNNSSSDVPAGQRERISASVGWGRTQPVSSAARGVDMIRSRMSGSTGAASGP